MTDKTLSYTKGLKQGAMFVIELLQYRLPMKELVDRALEFVNGVDQMEMMIRGNVQKSSPPVDQP